MDQLEPTASDAPVRFLPHGPDAPGSSKHLDGTAARARVGFATADGDTAETMSMPLVIDLDGTLVRTDTLIESLFCYLRTQPLRFFHVIIWLLQGRAVLKHELAHRARLDIDTLPLNARVVEYAAAERDRGRRVYLATAADRGIAQRVADYCGLFDGVLASDRQVNLKGWRKLEALRRRFPTGFAYAGNSRADIPLWHAAREAILVGDARWIRRVVHRLGKPAAVFPTPSRLLALARSARPHQWAKNALVFVPGILSGALFDQAHLVAVVLSFVAICLIASGTYLANDLWDLAEDRRHWSKCRRPLACGDLSIATALGAIAVGLTGGLILAVAAATAGGLVVACYLLLTLAYSLTLKRVPILDVVVLAGLFTLRLVLGIVSSQAAASPWLLTFSMFLFSSLCFAKRLVEIERSAARDRGAVLGRGYRQADAPLVFALGTGTGVASIVVMVLYITSEAFTRTFAGNTTWLWAFPVILFLWLARVWLVAGRGELDDDPVAFAVTDPPSCLLGAAMVVAFLLAWLGVFA